MNVLCSPDDPSPPSKRPVLRILLVDDDRFFLTRFTRLLKALENVEVFCAESLTEARQVLEGTVIHIAFIDLQLGDDTRNRDGLVLLEEIGGRYLTTPVVVSGHQHREEIHEALKQGAKDYVSKAELDQRVPLIVEKFRIERELQEELQDLRARGASDPNLGLVGSSVAMQNLRELIRKVATTNGRELFPVLVQGPTGSGKELVAQAIHKLGPHPSDPFFDLNCGALPESLFEDLLFGHVRGAFTDAHTDREGYLSLVRRGTLFLDEVAELSPALQAKLLRVLEDRRFRPLGPTAREQIFQGRIVAATHVDLRARIQEKRFREDLFFRLNVVPIRVPALPEHLEDVPELVQHFSAMQRRPMHFTQEAIAHLCRHPWPGNVRELRNVVDRLAILVDAERIDGTHLERYLPLEDGSSPAGGLTEELEQLTRKLLALALPDKLDAILEALVLGAVDQARGNNTEAGRLLGRSRKFVERFLKKLSTPRRKRGRASPVAPGVDASVHLAREPGPNRPRHAVPQGELSSDTSCDGGLAWGLLDLSRGTPARVARAFLQAGRGSWGLGGAPSLPCGSRDRLFDQPHTCGSRHGRPGARVPCPSL